MAPKRSVKNVSILNYNTLTLTDVLCPICRSILIEPVTLPCNHGFCSSCFDGTVANTNLVCPLCRVRIGSWLRTSKKDNKLVNSVLWEAIQKTFPEQVKNKYNGIEDYPVEDVPRQLTAPGEIHREYEEQKAKDMQELERQREVEFKASKELIEKLKQEEEYEEKIRSENNRLSEKVAKQLAQEYCFDPGPSNSKSKATTSKKHGPIDKLLKNMGEKKLTITLQSVPKNITSKEYTCKILCQDRSQGAAGKSSVVDKAALLHLKMQDKFKKLISEGEASDSNDSIDSECRYFKPIEQRCVPLPRKAPIVKVPAIIATANTVIIGPPKGETNFIPAKNGSAFAVVKIIALPISVSQNEIIKGNVSGNMCDMVITEVEPIEKCEITTESPKRHTRNKLQTIEFSSPHSSKTYETRSKSSNQKSPVRDNERTPEKNKSTAQKLVFTPSKRKRIRDSPVVNEIVSSKRPRIRNGNLVVSPPFHGFDNKNLNTVKGNLNCTIPNEDGVRINNVNANSIKKGLKKLQEEEDFKIAKQLHDELNNKYRYSTRNSSINLQVRNVTKPTSRQVTLKEIMSQKTNKIP